MQSRDYTGRLAILAAAVLHCGGCVGADYCDQPPDWGPVPDGAQVCSDPTRDDDGDGIPSGVEDCLRGVDSDGDKTPDWLDHDSDGDRVPDKVEKGGRDTSGRCTHSTPAGGAWPCDTDGDKIRDYRDKDSDGDGVNDGDEDQDGDGQIGCCLITCSKPLGAQSRGCTPGKDGCGSGQTCASGKCTPAAALACSNGETDRLKADSFGDGKKDKDRSTFICRDATELDPRGRKPVQLQGNAAGDWRLALEKKASYGLISIPGAGAKEAAAAIDLKQEEVAGFVLSRISTKDLQSELQDLRARIINNPVGDTVKKVSQRVSGISTLSHDLYQTVQGTTLDLKLLKGADVSTIRNDLVAALLGRERKALSSLPAAWPASHTELIIRFTTVKRIKIKKDAQGRPVDVNGTPVEQSKKAPADSGDKSAWRLLVMGAVASRTRYQGSAYSAGILVDDLSNGSALAHFSDAVRNECDANTVQSTPVADIIWVVDDSGSMTDNREDIVKNAKDFFDRAVASNLDFRMGVTNVVRPNGRYASLVGKFCSVASTDNKHDGGEDRFLLPSERDTFAACVKNPPGSESAGYEYGLLNARKAVENHLPRAANDKAKIRAGAQLVIIVASDEMPHSFGSQSLNICQLKGSLKTYVEAKIKPYLDLFSGITTPEAVAQFHAIAGICNNSCGADIGHGYLELAQLLGGQVGDVCQENLGQALQAIIDSVVASSSPFKLRYVPISSSLAVASRGKPVGRSRVNGFDYRATARGPFLVFVGIKYSKGDDVVASYKRWRQPIVVY